MRKMFAALRRFCLFMTKTGARTFFFLLLIFFIYLAMGTFLATIYAPVLATLISDVFIIVLAGLFILPCSDILLPNANSPSLANSPANSASPISTNSPKPPKQSGKAGYTPSKPLSAKTRLLRWGILSLLWLAMFYIGQLCSTLISLHGDALYRDYEKATHVSQADMLLLAVIIIGPVCEELMYRGITFGILRIHLPLLAAWLFQAAIFAAMHMTLVHLPATFLLALFNGLLVIETASLWPAIASHVIFNIIATALPIYVPNWLLNWPTATILFAIVFVCLLGYFMYLKNGRIFPAKIHAFSGKKHGKNHKKNE